MALFLLMMVVMLVLMMVLMMMLMTVHVAALTYLVLMLVMMMFVYHMQCFFNFRCKGRERLMQLGCKYLFSLCYQQTRYVT